MQIAIQDQASVSNHAGTIALSWMRGAGQEVAWVHPIESFEPQESPFPSATRDFLAATRVGGASEEINSTRM